MIEIDLFLFKTITVGGSTVLIIERKLKLVKLAHSTKSKLLPKLKKKLLNIKIRNEHS